MDFPEKTQMLGLDIPVQRSNGDVDRLTSEGWVGTINLPTLSEELYSSARWFRIFTEERTSIGREAALEILRQVAGDGAR